jgi:Ca-activated chloride channel family protein
MNRAGLLSGPLLFIAYLASSGAIEHSFLAQTQSPKPDARTEREKVDQETVRLGTALVTVSVGIFDKKGQPVSHLTQEQFQVFEDDERQNIAFFGVQDSPISFGLLLDHSQSMGQAGKLQQAQAAALAFLRAGNPQNEALGLVFNNTPELLFDFTSDYQKIEASFNRLTPEGGTALYDAIISGLQKIERGRHRRRALVVITDGRDEHSQHTLAELLVRAQEAEVQIYSIGFFGPMEGEVYQTSGPKVMLVDGREVDNPRVVFTRLAEETGAKSFFPRSAAEMEKAIVEIATHLRRQYELGYYPLNENDSDRYRRIAVKVSGKDSKEWQVRARQGYRLRATGRQTFGENARTTMNDWKPLNEVNTVGPPVYIEKFDNPESGWPNNEESFYKKGKYNVLGSRVLPVGDFAYADFEASVDVESLQPTEPTRGGASQNPASSDLKTLPSFGLVFRINPDGYYLFVIAPARNGQFGFYRMVKVAAGQQTDLIPWRKETAIKFVNSLKVRCVGPQIDLYINTLRIGSLKDGTHSQGRLGFRLAGRRAVFDNVHVKTTGSGLKY